MAKKTADILSEVADYYSAKLAEYGESPRGVDWNGEGSQVLRFTQLSRVIRQTSSFTINDIGCGYGALLDYLTSRYQNIDYRGFDVSDSMIHAARKRYSNRPNVHFAVTAEMFETADYGIASGIFNVKLGHSAVEWSEYIESMLDVIDRTSRLGFSFNCLTSYSDVEKMRDNLYYADPCALFNICKRRYSHNVALLHDYGLYEFTILVRKNP